MIKVSDVVDWVLSGQMTSSKDGARDLDVRPSTARGRNATAVLEVSEDGRLLGYITRHGPKKFGTIRAVDLRTGTPRVRLSWGKALGDL